jgi:hypothetical protein
VEAGAAPRRSGGQSKSDVAEEHAVDEMWRSMSGIIEELRRSGSGQKGGVVIETVQFVAEW